MNIPSVPRPLTPGLFVLLEACTEEGGRLLVEGAPVTGTVAVPVPHEWGDSVERVRLDSYDEGEFVGPFADEILGINSSVCVVSDDSYSRERPEEVTSAIQLNGRTTVRLLSGRVHERPVRLGFWPDGSLASLHTIEAQARGGASVDCFWEWTEDGALKIAACSLGAFQSPEHRGSLVSFNEHGQVDRVSVVGDFFGELAPIEVKEDRWVLQSFEELLELQAATSLQVPVASEIEDQLLRVAAEWLRNSTHLEVDGWNGFGGKAPPVEFSRRLLDVCDFDSISIGSLGGIHTFRGFVDGDRMRLLNMARNFVASRPGRTAEVDHCIVGSTDTKLGSTERVQFRGSAVFDEKMEDLVSLRAPFLRDEWIALMMESASLKLVQISAGSGERNAELLAPVIERHPKAIFHYRGEPTIGGPTTASRPNG